MSEPRYRIQKKTTEIEVVANDGDVDAVSICLPDVYHSSVAGLMLKKGKHVLLEKPMATSVEECEELVKLSMKNNVKLMVAHMWRFHPEVQYIKKVVREGRIGHVVKAKSYAIYVREAPHGWYLQSKYAGGGPLLNVGVHAVDTLRFVTGEPRAERVYAHVGTVFGNYDVDDLAVVVIEFSGGLVAIIETGQNHPYADGVEASTQLFGTAGYARIFPTELQLKSGDAWIDECPDIRLPHISPFMFQDEIDHFIDCIHGNCEPIIGSETAMENVQIIESAYRSAKTGKAVEIHH
jgi:predicted dehydrogenase